ncbi:BTB/POZ and MATH domain-containing protein 3-like [Panicum miliaceum]|uniref:BTB/POZ and MATH domain-containing protein 3-like n=1 Tax=Panicum miliaceum TaxID=4540 RepID=A0A3L6PRF4_PANMI|nr:BTB/POZ and MATH domain-containing protein 3-like [Panicum miliaceum]
MASSPEPREKTTSMCTAETDRCVHVFEIHGYSLHKKLGAGKFIQSAAFTVGGHKWRIRFYPGGREEESEHYVSVCLELLSKTAEVTAFFSFWLVDPATALPSLVFDAKAVVFNCANLCWGNISFKKTDELEASPYLRDDRLVIQCDVTVITGTRVSQSEKTCGIQVPPSDLSRDLGRLLDAAKRTDATFKVRGEVVHAHKIVLAMRSPVFEAELYGPVGEDNRQTISIEDMEPAIFKPLLQFIYTDSLPAMDDLDGDEKEETVKHLLVAADRYAMERMKVMCESILCEGLKVETVAETLALADQHNCIKLRDACIGFINSSKRMDAVVESSGFQHLKRACPTVFVDMWEKIAKSRRI